MFFCSGQESAGICTSEGNSKHFNVKKGMGMINMVFNDEAMRKLKGNSFETVGIDNVWW